MWPEFVGEAEQEAKLGILRASLLLAIGGKKIFLGKYVRNEWMNENISSHSAVWHMKTVEEGAGPQRPWEYPLNDAFLHICLMLLHNPCNHHVFIFYGKVQHDWLIFPLPITCCHCPDSPFPLLECCTGRGFCNHLPFSVANQVYLQILDFLRLHSKWKAYFHLEDVMGCVMRPKLLSW